MTLTTFNLTLMMGKTKIKWPNGGKGVRSKRVVVLSCLCCFNWNIQLKVVKLLLIQSVLVIIVIY